MEKERSKIVRNPSVDEIKKRKEETSVKATIVNNEEEVLLKQESNKTNQKQIVEKYKPRKSLYENHGIKFRLPSGKTTIDEYFLDDEEFIIVKPMTTAEEDMILNMVFSILKSSNGDLGDSTALEITRNFTNIMDDIIDKCLRTNISVYDLSLIDKVLLFVFILAISYGEKHEFEIVCPNCETKNKIELSIFSDLTKMYFSDSPIPYPFEVKLLDMPGDVTIVYIFPKIGNLILDQSNDEFRDSLKDLIIDIKGIDPEGNEIEFSKELVEEIVQYISPNDRKLIQDKMKEFGEKYGTGFNIENKFICSNQKCGHYNVTQGIHLPLEQMFIKIINNLLE